MRAPGQQLLRPGKHLHHRRSPGRSRRPAPCRGRRRRSTGAASAAALRDHPPRDRPGRLEIPSPRRAPRLQRENAVGTSSARAESRIQPLRPSFRCFREVLRLVRTRRPIRSTRFSEDSASAGSSSRARSQPSVLRRHLFTSRTQASRCSGSACRTRASRTAATACADGAPRGFDCCRGWCAAPAKASTRCSICKGGGALSVRDRPDRSGCTALPATSASRALRNTGSTGPPCGAISAPGASPGSLFATTDCTAWNLRESRTDRCGEGCAAASTTRAATARRATASARR